MSEKIYDTTKIAKMVRRQLKKEIPTCKFSVTSKWFSGGSSISVALMTAPFPVFAKDVDCNGNKRLDDYAQLNHHQLRRAFDYDCQDPGICNGVFLTPKAWEVLSRAVEIGQLHNWDNSDIQTDYFDVNYYFDIEIGRWNKPFQIKERSMKRQRTKRKEGSTVPKYIVNTREVWIQSIEVEAESAFEAKEKVRFIGYDVGVTLESGFEYSHVLDSDCWTVEEVRE